jgi:hypothetical protein
MDVEDAWNSDYIKARKYSLVACVYLTDPGLIPGAFLYTGVSVFEGDPSIHCIS